MKRALVVVLLLTGCATAPQQLQVTSGVKTLPPQQIPVPVPCLTADKIPKPPGTWMRNGQSLEKLETANAIDAKEMDRYIVVSQNRMWDCVKSLEEEEKK